MFFLQVEYQCCPQQLATESPQLAVDVDPQKQVALGEVPKLKGGIHLRSSNAGMEILYKWRFKWKHQSYLSSKIRQFFIATSDYRRVAFSNWRVCFGKWPIQMIQWFNY